MGAINGAKPLPMQPPAQSIGRDGLYSSLRPDIDAPTPGYKPKKTPGFAPWKESPFKEDHDNPLFIPLLSATGVGALVGAGISYAAVKAGNAIPMTKTLLNVPKRGILLGVGLALAGAGVGAFLVLRNHGSDTNKGLVNHEPIEPGAIADHGEPSSLVDAAMGDSALTPANIFRKNNEYKPKSGDLLPDITPIAPMELTLDTSNDRRMVRFSSTWPNVGQGPLEISFNRDSYSDVRQRVLTRTGERREVNSNSEVFHDGRGEHDHTHLNDFATYQLFEANADGTAGNLVAAHNKVSFMITDVDNPLSGLDPDGYHRRSYDADPGRVVQGMSVGWGDTYGSGLDGQEFDVTDLKDGKYILRQSFDPNDRLAETSETNNSFDTLITLSHNSDELDPKAIGAPRLPAPAGVERTDGRQSF